MAQHMWGDSLRYTGDFSRTSHNVRDGGGAVLRGGLSFEEVGFRLEEVNVFSKEREQ